MIATILTTIFLLQTFYISCDLIEPRTALVNYCPKNKNETIQASEKLECGVDEYGNNQYLCLPHVNKTSLVEFCFDGIMGIQEKGNCLETDGRKIIPHSCSNFSDGCPEKSFFDYEFYKYPACQNISTEFHCYHLDPFCSTQSTMEKPTAHEETDVKSIILGVSIPIVCILVICAIVFCLVKRKYLGTKDCAIEGQSDLALHSKQESENEDCAGEEHNEPLLQSQPESTKSDPRMDEHGRNRMLTGSITHETVIHVPPLETNPKLERHEEDTLNSVPAKEDNSGLKRYAALSAKEGSSNSDKPASQLTPETNNPNSRKSEVNDPKPEAIASQTPKAANSNSGASAVDGPEPKAIASHLKAILNSGVSQASTATGNLNEKSVTEAQQPENSFNETKPRPLKRTGKKVRLVIDQSKVQLGCKEATSMHIGAEQVESPCTSGVEFRDPESPYNETRPLHIASGEKQNNIDYRFNSAFSAKVFSSDTDNEIRIVLLGKTGAGKSATGNSILGGKVFESMASASSITSRCTLKSAFRFGYNIVIVDTPGIFDTSLPNQSTQEEIRKCIAITSPGPHAFILVLSISRFTEEEQKSVEHFVEHFGESVYRYIIVLFTRKDDLDEADISLQDFIKTSPENLKIIIEKCSGRVIAFNNKLIGEKNHEQASELIDMILKNIEENGGIFYTNELYEDAEKRLKKREKEIIIETEKEREKELIATQKFYQVQEINNAFSAKLEKLKKERANGTLSMEQFENKRKEANDMFHLQFLSLHEEESKIVQEKYEKKSKSTRSELRNIIAQNVDVFDSIHG